MLQLPGLDGAHRSRGYQLAARLVEAARDEPAQSAAAVQAVADALGWAALPTAPSPVAMLLDRAVLACRSDAKAWRHLSDHHTAIARGHTTPALPPAVDALVRAHAFPAGADPLPVRWLGDVVVRSGQTPLNPEPACRPLPKTPAEVSAAPERLLDLYRQLWSGGRMQAEQPPATTDPVRALAEAKSPGQGRGGPLVRLLVLTAVGRGVRGAPVDGGIL